MIALTRRFAQNDLARLQAVADLARAAKVPAVATGDVLYHAEGRRVLQDVVTCIRLGCTIDRAGFRKERHADRHLKAPHEVRRLFERHPDAVARTLEIVERCRFSLDELRYQYRIARRVKPTLSRDDRHVLFSGHAERDRARAKGCSRVEHFRVEKGVYGRVRPWRCLLRRRRRRARLERSIRGQPQSVT